MKVMLITLIIVCKQQVDAIYEKKVKGINIKSKCN